MANGLFKLPPIIGDDPRLTQYMLDDLKETYVPTSNMNNPAYVQGVTAVRPYDVYTDKEGAGIGGYVDTFKAPTTVNLSTPFTPDATRVFAHEVAHVQKNIVDRQVSKDKQNDTIAQALQRESRGEEGSSLRKQLEQNFRNYVKSLEIQQRSPSAIGGYGLKNTSWEERFADLQSLESQLPRGKSLLDTSLGQQVFNTPELKRYWLQTTLPLQAKALEQNPELQENFFDKLEIFKQTFKDEAKTRSFANAAFSALKKAYQGKKEQVVTPMYQDPFGDTTK
jgi:hypothetical protein